MSGHPHADRSQARRPRVAIVGGGLAGLAAASALESRGLVIELFEATKTLGGRAGSFAWNGTPGSGRIGDGGSSTQWIDHCQHVGMGCCTNWLDFCKRTDTFHLLRQDHTLYFVAPGHRPRAFRGAPWLPAPLHLLPSLMGLGYLTRRERLNVIRAFHAMLRDRPDKSSSASTIDTWLRRHHQSDSAIRNFWTPVIVSALSESPKQCSYAAARQVFVKGMMAHRDAYTLYLPTCPLNELYDTGVGRWLNNQGVRVHRETAVQQIGTAEQAPGDDRHPGYQVTLRSGRYQRFDYVILAVPWHQAWHLLSERLAAKMPHLHQSEAMATGAITSAHLWFDRPITALPHAVLVGRFSQWLFRRDGAGHAYQVVISAAHQAARRDRHELLRQILRELRETFPAAEYATLVDSKIVTQKQAVFCPEEASEALRPAQKTALPGLFLAGDWTRTGWPATMESAVRSGYLAAEALLATRGTPIGPIPLVQGDLTVSPFMRRWQ